MRSPAPVRLLPVVGLLAGLTLTACGGSSGGDNPTVSAPSGGASAGASAGANDPKSLLPASITKAGTLRAATDGTYPPNEFTGSDGKQYAAAGDHPTQDPTAPGQTQWNGDSDALTATGGPDAQSEADQSADGTNSWQTILDSTSSGSGNKTDTRIHDNTSGANTAAQAEAAGAGVVREARQGYGHALCRGLGEAQGE